MLGTRTCTLTNARQLPEVQVIYHFIKFMSGSLYGICLFCCSLSDHCRFETRTHIRIRSSHSSLKACEILSEPLPLPRALSFSFSFVFASAMWCAALFVNSFVLLIFFRTRSLCYLFASHSMIILKCILGGCVAHIKHRHRVELRSVSFFFKNINIYCNM